jgi:DUF177 domain-containing protein
MASRSPAQVDPRSPLVIDTHELGRRPGSMLELQRDLPAPAGWALELVQVTPGAPVHLDARLESVVDGVLVSLEVDAPTTAECGRCLEPVTDTVHVSLAELFLYEPDPEDDELPVLDGEFANLDPVLRDAVVLALPFNPLCDEDCAGLCPTCGERLDDLEPSHSHEALDSRWAALSGLQAQNSRSSATMDDQSSPQPSTEPTREN